ncbi:MAG: FtsX-like permease family protein [Bacteroidales bacterium]|jgi:lipoprotein-releasing system permease protein|nr:FtsX-like permease family protein [Bacteroidales bacterium]
MKFELFITRHIIGKEKENLSRPAVRIGIISIALGLSVMILSIAILTGFQKEIREKVSGFSAHITITSYDFNKSLESTPVLVNQPFYPSLDTLDGIKHIQVFATKGGIMKTDEQMEGVILKGVGRDFDWSILENWIISGELPVYVDSVRSTEILISSLIADKLGFRAGDDVRMYFVTEGQKQPRGRKFTVAGIYSSGFEDFDAHYIYGDIRQIQRLNNWNENMVSGFEVFVDDFSKVEEIGQELKSYIGYHLKSETVKQTEEQIFSWLELQDMNVIVIVVLMVVVAGFSMISALLILILEKTNMIGILKALGSRNASIRRIFIMNAAYIIGIGLLWGNVIGIGLCLLQSYFSIIPLPVESYYVSTVPIHFSWGYILLLNAGTFIFCTLMMVLPSFFITRITPVKAIRFK